MNATTTPAKVARVGAQVPLMQDENSGKDGRRYNEWFASRLDARLRARESAQKIATECAKHLAGPVPASDKPIHFAVWLTWAISTLFSALGLWHLVGYLVRSQA